MRATRASFTKLFLLCLLTACLSAAAQDTTNMLGSVSIASPTAASLGKYGDVPVSYNTGIPNISIPLYNIESGSLRMPVSLSYHASGLKVQENASWVGAGWSLNAGGVITRTVVGAPDDKGSSANITTNGHYTDYGFNSYLMSGGLPDDIAFARGGKDGEPDLYFFNFNGITGKFYFNDDRTPMMIPEQDYKIQPYYQAGTGFQGFIITASDGTRYYFGQTGNNSTINPVETTIPATTTNGAATTNSAISSWFLNKVLSADGTDSITLVYAQETYSYYTMSLTPILMSSYYATVWGKNGVDVVKNMVSGVRLTQINFANGHVNFTPSSTARQDLSDYGSGLTDNANTSSFSLGSVSIFDDKGFCKKDSLYYGYWNDPSALSTFLYNNFSWFNIHSDAYRLRLDSVQEMSCDNSIKVPSYRFTYDAGTPPRKLSFGVDHWGFANGAANSNTGMVPTYTVITSGSGQDFPGANRDAVWPAMQAGALVGIRYPTGGSTNFAFEPKCTYTIDGTVYQDRSLAGFAVHMYGQSAITQTMSFSIVGDGACTIHVTNMSTNFSPTLVIKNSSNTVIYNSYYINYATTDANGTVTGTNFNATANLPVGDYTATLSYDAGSGTTVINGAYGNVGQWRYYPTTTSLLVGGLRVKTITQSDGITPTDVVTNYSYGGNANSTGGTLYSIPVYLQTIRNDLKKLVTPLSCSPNGCQSCDGVNGHEYFVSPGAIQPLSTMQGEHIGYDRVEVSQTGNGKTVYQYYGSNRFTPTIYDVCVRTLTQSSLCDQSIPNYPFPPLPFDFMRGELQFEGYYKEDGSFVKGTSYYPTYSADPITTPGMITVDKPGLYSHTEYRLQTGFKSQDKAVTTTYDDNHNVVTTTRITYFGSPYHHQPTRTITTTSTGDSLARNVKYAFDYRISSCDAIPDSVAYYTNLIYSDSLQMLSDLVSCSPQNNTSSNCRLTVYANYRAKVAQDRVKFINYRRRSFVDAGSLQPSCYLTALGSADAVLKPVLRLQNEFYDAAIETTEWKNLNLRHATFTRYDTSLSPIGYAYPGKSRMIFLSALSSSFTPSVISGSTISSDSRYADEETVKVLSGNTAEITTHDGLTISYLWDYQGKKPVAKIINSTADQASYTSFEADGNGGWNIPSTNRDSSTSATGRRCFNLQWGAITRSSLNSASTYIVSYWTNSGPFTVTGTIQMKQGKTINGWSLFEHTVTGVSSVIVSGGARIDELRLYPSNAQMRTYTYSPLVGITTQCDEASRCTYYVYDALGRLQVTKDQDGNILKTEEYHYRGQ